MKRRKQRRPDWRSKPAKKMIPALKFWQRIQIELKVTMRDFHKSFHELNRVIDAMKSPVYLPRLSAPQIMTSENAAIPSPAESIRHALGIFPAPQIGKQVMHRRVIADSDLSEAEYEYYAQVAARAIAKRIERDLLQGD